MLRIGEVGAWRRLPRWAYYELSMVPGTLRQRVSKEGYRVLRNSDGSPGTNEIMTADLGKSEVRRVRKPR